MSTAEDWEENHQIDVELEWQPPYHALTVLSKILGVFSDFVKQNNRISWKLVVDHLLFRHAWVRVAASRLLGLVFNSLPVAAPQLDLPAEHPLSVVGMQTIVRKFTQQFESEHLDEALSVQIVKNLSLENASISFRLSRLHPSTRMRKTFWTTKAEEPL